MWLFRERDSMKLAGWVIGSGLFIYLYILWWKIRLGDICQTTEETHEAEYFTTTLKRSVKRTVQSDASKTCTA